MHSSLLAQHLRCGMHKGQYAGDLRAVVFARCNDGGNRR